MKLASIISRLRQNKTQQRNHHFVFIEAPLDIVAPEIVLWGEASWWPKTCTMKFIRTADDEIKVGTRLRQKVLLPLAPSWDVKITKLTPGVEIERTFLNGFLEGFEKVTLEERVNGIRVDYTMEYRIQGSWNNALWVFAFEKMHDNNLEIILLALKKFCQKKVGH